MCSVFADSFQKSWITVQCEKQISKLTILVALGNTVIIIQNSKTGSSGDTDTIKMAKNSSLYSCEVAPGSLCGH